MHSWQIIDWGEPLQARDIDTPEPTGTEVLVKVAACGICHSDLHIRDGYFDLGGGNRLTLGDRGVDLPFTMGHEVVGEVVAVGTEAEDIAVGDKRIVYPWIGCRECAMCERGDELFCDRMKSIGARVDGGYSDHVIVPHAKYLIDYTGVPTDLACTYACSGITAYSALKKLMPLTSDDWLLITGAGGVGLSAVHIVQAMTDAKIVVADIDGTKRAAARQSGATETIDNAEPDAVRQIMRLTKGGVAGGIDFVGAPASSDFGVNALRKGGTHVIVGLYGGALELSLPLVPMKQITVRGSYVGTLSEMGELMALVTAGKVAPIPVRARPLAEVNEALDDLKQGRVLGRVVIHP